METTPWLLGTAFVLGCALGCGDEDKKEGGGSSNPAECSGGLTGQDSTGSCTEAEVKEYSDCVESACQTQYESCFGPEYRTGDYAGPCAGFLECTSGCDCEDDSCRSGCSLSAECLSCMAGFTSCGSSCLGKLSCANGGGTGGGGADGGGGGAKTCEDLLDCCNSLSDTARKQQCTMTHMQLSMFGGDAVCGPAVAGYCP